MGERKGSQEGLMKNFIAFRSCMESTGVSDEKLDNIRRAFQCSQVESVECVGCLMKIGRDGLVVKPDQRQHHMPFFCYRACIRRRHDRCPGENSHAAAALHVRKSLKTRLRIRNMLEMTFANRPVKLAAADTVQVDEERY